VSGRLAPLFYALGNEISYGIKPPGDETLRRTCNIKVTALFRADVISLFRFAILPFQKKQNGLKKIK
jgi:hypothetical protein